MLQPQQLFADRYRIVKPLAEGGMGVVFVAQHIATEALVALKVLSPNVMELDRARLSFELEAKVAARVRSEHIVKVLDAGLDATTRAPFLVMELLEGATLAELVARTGPRPWIEIVDWVGQAARGLDAAHGYRNALGVTEPIIHRDLKPENLFLTTGSHGAPLVKILDFGIAKVLGEATHLSKEVRGTPLYMSYEQVAGEEISPRTDVWALGLIAYFLLTGRPYWRSVDRVQALFAEILNLPMPAATERARADNAAIELPAGFDAWLFGCIDRDPNRRFASAGHAAQALAALETSANSAPPAAAGENAIRPLVPRPTGAFPVRIAPDGARAMRTLSTHQSGLGTFSVPDVHQPGTEFRADVLAREGSGISSVTATSVPSLTTSVSSVPEQAGNERAARTTRRKPVVAGIGALLLLLLAAVSMRLGHRGNEAPAPIAASARSATSAAPATPIVSEAVSNVTPPQPHSPQSPIVSPVPLSLPTVDAGAETSAASPSAKVVRRPQPWLSPSQKPRVPASSSAKKPPAFVELPP